MANLIDTDEVVIEFSTSLKGSAKIRWLTRSRFSHVDVVLPHGLLGASGSPPDTIVKTHPRGAPTGVAVRKFDYQPFKRRHRAVIKTELAPYILEKGLSQLGKPFDARALYAIYLPWLRSSVDWLHPDSWYCMELVLWMFLGEHGPQRKRFFDYEVLIQRNLVVPEDGILIFNPYISNIEKFKFSLRDGMWTDANSR
jgi:hypothetical protein